MSFDVVKLKPFDEFSSEKQAGVNELVYGLLKDNDEYPIIRGTLSSIEYIANTAVQVLNTPVAPKSVVSVEKNFPTWLNDFNVISTYVSPIYKEYLPLNFVVEDYNIERKLRIYISNPTDDEFVIDSILLYILRICRAR